MLFAFRKMALGLLVCAVAGSPLGTAALFAQASTTEKAVQPKKSAPDVPADKLSTPSWKASHERFLETAKKGGVDVLFIGDSITAGWGGSGKDVWKKEFEAWKPANFGIGGDRTEHVLWRITEGKELEGINPKVCVMMIGTNNTGNNSAEEIAKGIEAILKEFKKQKPTMKVLLLAVFPRGSAAKEDKVSPKDKLNMKIPKINEIISKFADDKTVFYKDIGGKFLNAEGGLPREIMPDLLHLSPKGYEIWAEAIKPDVEKLMK